MTWHSVERARLAAALLAAGPDAPTLCEGWLSRHLAAHVILRETSLVASAGAVVPALAPRTEQAIEDLSRAADTDSGYRDLVARVAAEPPRWHPASWAGELMNVIEFAVHTEDVRRGGGDLTPAELPAGLQDELWRQLLRSARLTYRHAQVGVVLVRPDDVRRRVRTPTGDHGTVVVHGAVVELLLHAYGRGRAADVTVTGDPADVAAFTTALPVG